MISVHPTPADPNKPWAYAENFQLAFGLSLDEISDIIEKSVWSPNTFKGGVRKNENFQASFYMTLDFDSGETTLKEAAKIFSDYKGIIGTSKSHRIVSDKNPLGVDRFRVIIPWEKPICDPVVYSYNMAILCDKYSCDSSCADLARYYFPCREVVGVSDGDDFYSYAVLPPSEEYLAEQKELSLLKKEEILKSRSDFKKYGRLKPWHERFLNKGILPEENGSRRWAMFSIAFYLYLCGAGDRDIFDLLMAGNYDKTGLKNLSKEIEGRMKSAKKKAGFVLLSLENENPAN